MPRLFSNRFWFSLLLGWLLTGCRSERVAFRFQPAPIATAVAPADRADSSAAASDTAHNGFAAAPGGQEAGRPPAARRLVPAGAPRLAAPNLLTQQVAEVGHTRRVLQASLATRLLRRHVYRAIARQAAKPAEHEFNFSTTFIVLFLLALGFGIAGLLTLLGAAISTSATTAYVGLALVLLAPLLFLLALLIGN